MAARRTTLGGKGEGVQYCRIAHWLETKHAELHRALRFTCLEMKLNPRPSDPPITFLVPSADLMKEILAALESDTPQARTLLGSLILPDFFGSADDFAQGEGEKPARPVGTLNRTRYDVKVEGKSIRLNGAEVEPEPSFRPTPELKERIAVWRLKTKPAFPTKAFELAPRTARPPRRADEKSGGAAGGSGGPPARQQLAERVITAAANATSFNPWLAATLAVLGHVDPATREMLTPLLDLNPVVCFYTIVQPYCTVASRHLIPDEVFGSEAVLPPGGGVPHTFSGSAVEAFKAYFVPWWTGDDKWASRDPKDVEACCQTFIHDRDALRYQAAAVTDAKEAGDKILSFYDTLVGTNRVGGHPAHLPASTIECLRQASSGSGGDSAHQGLFKLHEDELRFHLRVAMKTIETEACRGGTLGELLEEHLVSLVEHKMPGNSLREELCYVLPAQVPAGGISNDAESIVGSALIQNSTDLHYLSVPPACVGEKWGTQIDMLSDLPFNCHRGGLEVLEEKSKTFGGGSFGARRRRGLITGGGGVGGGDGSVRESLSEGALAELRSRIAACRGRLPPEVEALLHGAPGGE